MEIDSIYNLVKKAEKNLLFGSPIKIGKYATHSHIEKISTIDAYLNSQHISGLKDSLNREKPFFNIVLMAAYTWFKATDIDRKHIKFKPGNSAQRIKAMLATILLRNWMIKNNFGKWLNKWGYKLACYGSCVSKFVEKGKKLFPDIISWDRMICDTVDFDGNIKVEKLYFTPAQLRKQPYDQEQVEAVIKSFEQGRESRKNLEGEDIDIKSEFIGVYEAHGELPLFYLTNKEKDISVYVQQMHVIFVEGGKKKDKVEITLYSGREGKDPYYLSHLIESEGRTLSVGGVESLFDSQWMVNHSSKQVKDQLDLASKILTQTSDPQFLGRNITTEVETGQVLIHKEGQPLTQVNTQSHDIPQIIEFLTQWKQLAREISGANEAITGATMPSGTPYRLGAMLSSESHDLFNIMLENKGLHLEEILRIYVLPHFKKTLKNSDEVIALLEGEELEAFDNLTLPARLESELRSRLMQGRIPNREELMTAIDEQNSSLGSLRALKPSAQKDMTWADYFKDFDVEAMDIEITGENKDKQAIYQALNDIFQTLMTADPERLQDPNVKRVFNRLLDEIGPGIISPLQLSGVTPKATMPEEATGGGLEPKAPVKVETPASKLVKARI